MGSNQVLYLDGSVYIGSTTSSATSALQIDANQITSGNGLLLSGNAYVGSSNRGLLDVRSTSTARATNSSLIGVNSSGAVDTSVISRGLSSSVTNSGTNTTNIGFYSNASGAATNNYSFYGNAGDIYNAGSAYIGSTVFGYNGSFGNNLRVLGTSTLEAVTGTTGSFSSNLNVGGTSTLAAVTGTTGSFSSNLNVGGTSTLAAVTGTTGSFSGAVTGANGSFSSGAVSSFNSYTGSTVYGFNGSFANNLRVVGTSTLAAVTGTTGSFSSTLNVGGTSTFTGNSTFAGDIAVNGGDVFLPSTGTIGYYGSAAQQTLNIATFNATGTNSKTINIGTGFTGSAGGGQTATTNVNVGYAGSGTTTIHSPSTAVSGNLTVSGDANFEWQLVGATDNFTTDTFTISSSNIYRADGVTISSFDTNNYDYKFVYYASCNTEESGTNIDSATSIKLRINGITSQKRYGWIAQRIVRGDGGFGDNNFEDTDGTSGNAADDRTSRIHTITILDDISNASSSGQTFVKLEFTISESYAPSLTSGIMMIEGEGNAVFSTTSSVVEFKSGTSKAWFTGTVSGASSLTSVTFLDTIGVTTTSTEFQKVQVYRRKRLTFTA
jgi:hypothetical protein